MTAAVTGTT